MGRRKVTYEIDEELVRGIKAASIGERKPEYQVVEDALNAHLLGPLLKRMRAEAGDLDPDEAMRIAIEEIQAMRAERKAGSRKGSA